MSLSVTPNLKDFEAAIDFLFAFQTLRTNYEINIIASDVKKYAEIGVFLSDMDLVKKVMRDVSIMMQKLFDADPVKFSHTDESNFTARNLGHFEAFKPSDPPAKLKRQELQQFQNNEKAKTKAIETLNQEQEKIRLPGLPEIALTAKKGIVVRRFRFHQLLCTLESELLGLTDNRLVLTEDVGINEILRKGEVWKDSIGFEHGEYTHRLQWLAVAVYFQWSKADLLRLYKGCSATLKRSVFEAFGMPNLKEISNATSADMAVPVSLWEFLFDCRQTRGQAQKTWPTYKGPSFDTKPWEAYRFAARSDSGRTPVIFNKMLRTDASFGLIFAYLTASEIKTLGIKDGNVLTSLSAYRKARQKDKESSKFDLNKFETPFDSTQ